MELPAVHVGLGMFSLEKRRPWGALTAAKLDWKGPIGKMGTECSAGPVARGEGGMAFNCSRSMEAGSEAAAFSH